MFAIYPEHLEAALAYQGQYRQEVTGKHPHHSFKKLIELSLLSFFEFAQHVYRILACQLVSPRV